MRLLTILLSTALLYGTARAQGANQPPAAREHDDIYVMALRAALEAQSSRDRFDVAVWKREDVTDKLPRILGSFQVTVLDDREQRTRFRKVGRFLLLKMYPATVEGEFLRVSISSYWYSYRGGFLFLRSGMHEYALEGGTNVYIRFNPEKRTYVVDHARHWGV